MQTLHADYILFGLSLKLYSSEREVISYLVEHNKTAIDLQSRPRGVLKTSLASRNLQMSKMFAANNAMHFAIRIEIRTNTFLLC